MQPRLTAAAALILPDESLDAIAFACTAASVVIGDEAVRAALDRAKPGVPCVTPTSAAFAAFAGLGMSRVSILAPYTPRVSDALARYFADHGVEVAGLRCFGLEDDRVIARVAPAAIIEAAIEAIDPDADGLFISCTGLRAAEVVEEIEARVGRPVVTSNQAMIWRAARLAGCDLPINGHGRLARL
jgi:maleate isomerase